MPLVAEDREFVRHDRGAGRVARVDEAIAVLPAPEFDQPRGADESEERGFAWPSDVDVVARVHVHAHAARGLHGGYGDGLDLHPVAIRPGAAVGQRQDRGNWLVAQHGDDEVEPVDTRVDDVPARALDLHQRELADFAALDTVDDLEWRTP